MSELVTLREIQHTRAALPKVLRRTPILPLADDPADAGNERLFLKAENLQITGAYKPRAAFARVAAIPRMLLDKGIVLTSSGNFAQAFALAGRLVRSRVVCVMLDQTSPFKVEAARALGAEVVFCGTEAAARPLLVKRIAEERGMHAIDTWEDREIIAGHGSIGLELLEDLPDVAMVLVPVSSGGGAAGISIAIKESRPKVKVIGVQPAGANAAYLSRRAGRLVTLRHWDSIADGLSAIRPGEFPFAHLQKFLDDIVLVSDTEIADACRTLLYRGKLLAEPAGAVAVAAALTGKVQSSGKIVAVVTGGNVAPARLSTLFLQ